MRMEHVLDRDPIGLAFSRSPRDAPHEPVDCIAVLRLRERELVPTAVELVRPVLDPVRPWQQDLSPPRRAYLVCGVSIEDLPVARAVGAESTAHLDDDRTLVAGGDLDLLARGSGHGRKSTVRRAERPPLGCPRNPATREDPCPITFA